MNYYDIVFDYEEFENDTSSTFSPISTMRKFSKYFLPYFAAYLQSFPSNNVSKRKIRQILYKSRHLQLKKEMEMQKYLSNLPFG